MFPLLGGPSQDFPPLSQTESFGCHPLVTDTLYLCQEAAGKASQRAWKQLKQLGARGAQLQADAKTDPRQAGRISMAMRFKSGPADVSALLLSSPVPWCSHVSPTFGIEAVAIVNL